MDPRLDPWERHAGWWQEHFTAGADAEYEEQILPLVAEHLRGAGAVLDVGCGEGQVARLLQQAGARVVGVDATAAQLGAARARGGGPSYVRGRSEQLPFADGVFDGAVICLVLEHLASFEPALDEVARVVGRGGRFALFLNHPLLQAPDSGWIDDQILEEQYWRVGPYLPEHVGEEEVAPGVVLPFVHRPLHRYVNGLLAAGFVLEHMDEPAPPPGFLARASEYADAATIPRLLVLVARRR